MSDSKEKISLARAEFIELQRVLGAQHPRTVSAGRAIMQIMKSQPRSRS